MQARRPALVALALALLGPALLAGCLREFEDPHFVRIANVDLAAERVLAGDVLLNATTYLDNAGGGSTGALRLLAKAYDESTGFLVAEQETEVAPIGGDTTRIVSQQVRVQREGSVRLEVQLFEDDRATQRASVMARNLGQLDPEVFETGLEISEMDFTVVDDGRAGRNGGNGGNGTGNASRPTIEASLYLTNDADEPSEDLRVQVKAREVHTRLVADTQWLTTGSIAPGTTAIRSVNLSVPDGYNYLIEILTWRGDVIVDRAEGRVQLAPTFEIPQDQEVVITDPDISDFRRPASPTAPTQPGSSFGGSGDYAPHEPEGVPAPGAALALGAIALGAAAFTLHRRRRA